MLVRPFSENALEVAGWIDDQEVPVFKYGTSDILSSQYWQIPDEDILRDLTYFFSVLPRGHLLGLSVDCPTFVFAEEGEDEDSETANAARLEKCIAGAFDIIMVHSHLLADVNSLYIFTHVAIDLQQLLDALPDLKNLLIWGCTLDISFVRHANLEWLGMDSSRPMDGLELASLPALRGLELDEIPLQFMASVQHAKFPKLDHFGVIGLKDCTLPELFKHIAFPKNLNSLYIDVCYVECSASDIQQYPDKKTLKRLCTRNQTEYWDDVYIETHFPAIEHLGILDAPEEKDAEFADYVVRVLSNPLLPKGITRLDLHGVYLHSSDMRVLLDLPLMQRLKYLNITHHNIENAKLLKQVVALRLNGCTVIGVQ